MDKAEQFILKCAMKVSKLVRNGCKLNHVIIEMNYDTYIKCKETQPDYLINTLQKETYLNGAKVLINDMLNDYESFIMEKGD